MIDFKIADACMASWPNRPQLNVSEFLYSEKELSEAVDWHMWFIEPLMTGAPRG